MTARIRQQGSFKPGTVPIEYRRKTTCSEGNWTYNATFNPASYGSRKEMYDVVTPGFHRGVAKGQVFFNDMSMVEEEYTGGTGSGYLVTGKTLITPCNYYGEWKSDHSMLGTVVRNNNTGVIGLPTALSSSSDIDRMRGLVTTSMLAKRGQADSNLFESLAEIRQTLQLLRRPMSAFGRFANSKGPSIQKLSPSKAWLTYRYAVMPIIRDIDGIIRGLEKPIGTVRKTTRAHENSSRHATETYTASLGVVSTQMLKVTNETIDVRAMSLDEYAADVFQNVGFTGKGLAGLPWELIPYSFVVDWFANVGDFLYAVMPTPNLRNLGMCVVTRINLHATHSSMGSYSNNPLYTVNYGPSGALTASSKTVIRRAIGFPKLSFKSDFRFDDPVRVADALSLIAQRFSRFFSKR